MNLLIYKNPSVRRGGEKMYLNHRTADVFFTFQIERVKVPAHKNVLSAISPVFRAMFNDAIAHKGVIQLVDTTSAEFIDFLKFFYLRTVEVTAENALEVMKLGKKYAVKSCLDACTEFCKSTLTLDSMCWGYELAILFKLDDLRRFCEQQIIENPKKIFRSISFLMCEVDLLHCILQLDSLQCDAITVFHGCIAWAREVCIQQGLDESNVEKMRAKLGDLFFEIPFEQMELEHFYALYCSHKDLFSVDEFEDILSMIALKDFHSEKFNRNPRVEDRLRAEVMCN